jgi:hypothetical protein
MTGKADSREWADQLREHLYLAGGRPQNQRPHDDPKRLLLPVLLSAPTYPSESSRNICS